MKPLTQSLGAFEAKTRLSELLERVSRGASFTITKHDRPVARLVGVETDEQFRREKATAALKRLRVNYSLKGLDIKKLREEGRA